MSEPQLRQIAAGVHAWIGAGGDSNAGAVDTPHGLMVIDAQQNAAMPRYKEWMPFNIRSTYRYLRGR